MQSITCHDVANYFLRLAANEEDGGDIISNLKLQKLVYYAQGFHLAMFEKPLFNERIEAWTHGPVVPELYRANKEYGDGAIPFNKDFDISKFEKKQSELLDEIYQVYGQFSAWKLRDLTHEESPWLKNKATRGCISHTDLSEYFKSQLN